ncbi:MAG: hypothetical protein LBC96_09665 [Lachnospiraceae bacterium]|jgi:hypothetical protein|nr:hypothetical protein [Lachnospiraceae bacterium]
MRISGISDIADKKIIIYGAGGCGHSVYALLTHKVTNANIQYFCDTFKTGIDDFTGVKIKSLSEIEDVKGKLFIIALSDYLKPDDVSDVESKLVNMGVSSDCILKYSQFMSMYEMKCDWQNFADNIYNFDTNKVLIEELAAYITTGDESVVDLGAGNMNLKMFIHPDISYYPVDFKSRSDETIVCDLNKGEFPDIYADVYVLCAMLYYMEDPVALLKQCILFTEKKIIIALNSKNMADSPLAFTGGGGIKNHIYFDEIDDLLKQYCFESTSDIVIESVSRRFVVYERVNTYNITKAEPIAVYGGGYIGLSLTRKLLAAGYNVCAVLDINPAAVIDSPIPVVTAEEFYSSYGAAFVFVSLGDGVVHAAVARRLITIGFSRILFLPLYLRTTAAKQMVMSWNIFFTGSYNVIMPTYDSLWDVYASDFVFYDDGNFVFVLIHKDFVRIGKWISREQISDHLYSSYYEMETSVKKSSLGKTIESMEGDRYNEEKIDFYENSLFYDPQSFFVNCAAVAIFDNKTGYFNLVDGWHRLRYMLKSGFCGMPLKIRKAEWELFFNEQQAKNLMNHCKNIEYLPFQIKHPAFFHLPVKEGKPDEVFLQLYGNLYPEGSDVREDINAKQKII